MITAIHNAPSLEKLVFTNAAVKITDIELIHSKATKLKHLEFTDVGIYTDDKDHQVTYQPTAYLEVFALQNITPVELNEGYQRADEAIKNCISYIGRKYPQVRQLYLNLESIRYMLGEIEDKESITKCMAAALKNMKNLEVYSVDFASRSTFDVMESSNVQLNHLGFLISTNDLIEEMFTSMQTGSAVSTISSLLIAFTEFIDVSAISQRLIDVCLNLQHITSLQINCKVCINTTILLIDIIQSLTMLEGLVIGDVMIRGETTDVQLHSKLSTIRTGRLESICLTYGVYPPGELKDLNLSLDFVLRSCSNLNDIEFSAEEIRGQGIIDLDFTTNHLLSNIKLEMTGCKYFTFHHEFGKYWKNMNEQITQTDITMEDNEDLPYFVNLAWDHTKYVDLQLTGCEL